MIEAQKPGKNKMLLQAHDVSGSMCGRPMEALKEACLQLGKRYYDSDKKPFEKFVTMTHHHAIDREFTCADWSDYEKQVKSLYANGGNNFLVAFERILAIIKENPGLEELVIIFVTDGHDCRDGYRGRDYDQDLIDVAKKIQNFPGLKTSYMCIGFSQHHNATQMNQIAKFGSEQGNFIYVDTNMNDYQEAINEALGDSFDIALGSNSAVKFQIENQ